MEKQEAEIMREIRNQIRKLRLAKRKTAKARRMKSELVRRISQRCLEKQLKKLRRMILNPLYRKAWNTIRSRRTRLPP